MRLVSKSIVFGIVLLFSSSAALRAAEQRKSADPVAELTIRQGYAGEVFSASPAIPDPQQASFPCALSFVGPAAPATAPGSSASAEDSTKRKPVGIPLSVPDGAANACVRGALGAAKGGLQIVLAVGAIRAFEHEPYHVNNLDFRSSAKTYLTVEVRALDDPSALGISVDRDYHTFAVNDGAKVKQSFASVTATKYEHKGTACYSKTAASPKVYAWCTTVVIPWQAFRLQPRSRARYELRGTVHVREGDLPLSALAFGVTTQDANARAAWLSQYDQFRTQALAPPSSLTLPFVRPGGSAQLVHYHLASPFTPGSSIQRFPAPNIELDSALSATFRVAAALGQSNTVVQSLQQTIKSGMKPLPTETSPKYPCETCQSFQTINQDVFGQPKVSTNASAIPVGFFDDFPFQVSTLPDLAGAVGVYRASSLGTDQYGALVANPSVTSQSGSSPVDETFAFLRHDQSQYLWGAASYVSHLVSTKSTAPMSVPSLSMYSGMYSDALPSSRTTGSGGTLATVAPVLRLNYDARDTAASLVAGSQYSQTLYSGAMQTSVQGTVFAGYRAISRQYHVLDGVSPAYPGVSGPIASLDLALKDARSAATPRLELSGYGNSFTSSLDRFHSGEVKLQTLVAPNLSISYELLFGTISAPLASVAQLGGQLGDAPYENARLLLNPVLLKSLYSTSDRTVAVSYKSSGFANNGTISATAGYDYDHEAPTCKLPDTIIECTPPTRTGQLTAQAGLSLGSFGLALSYKPTFFEGSRSISQSERVYNVGSSYSVPSICTTLFVAASNDAGVVASTPDQVLSASFSAELDSQLVINDRRSGTPWLQPTLVVGASNSFGTGSAKYTGVSPITGDQLKVAIPYRTHTPSFYVALRLGNRASRLAAPKSCQPAS
jgi:hypothetical protein